MNLFYFLFLLEQFRYFGEKNLKEKKDPLQKYCTTKFYYSLNYIVVAVNFVSLNKGDDKSDYSPGSHFIISSTQYP